MRKLWLGIFWILLFLPFSFAAFTFENREIENPILKEEDILRLIHEGIVPIYFSNGTVIFYNLTSKKVVREVKYGNLTLVSNLSSRPGDIVLNEKDLELWRKVFVMRNISDQLDLELLKIEDPLFYEYIIKRYPTMEEYLKYVFGEQGIRDFDLKSIEKFLHENYDINPIYDFRSIYKSLLDKKIGYSQYHRILKELIKDENLIEKYSQLYKDPIFRKLIESLSEDIKREILKEMIKESLKEENLKLLIELAKNVDKEALIEILRDSLREAMKNKEIREAYEEASKEIGENIWNFIRENWRDIVRKLSNSIEKFLGRWSVEVAVIIFLIALAYLIKI